jgi:oligosaccharide translocation protein RFT1
LFSKVENKDDSSLASVVFDLFTLLLKVHLILGLFFISLGTNYTELLFTLLAGPQWSQTAAPHVLSWYCFFIPWLGANGLTEALVHSVASKQQLQSLNRWMLLFSAIYLSVGFCLMKVAHWGPFGLITANVLNFGMRIMWCWSHAVPFFAHYKLHLQLSSLAPRIPVLVTFAATWIVTSYSQRTFTLETGMGKILHTCVGVLCGLLDLFIM